MQLSGVFLCRIDLPVVVFPDCVAVGSAKVKVTAGHLCGGDVCFPS